MRIAQRLVRGNPCFSFEFFPPKTKEGIKTLFATLRDLESLKPGFVSVTYGAGGSTRTLTSDLVSRIRRETGIEAMAHLTCVGHSREELKSILQSLKDQGVENVLALRGDPPAGEKNFTPAPNGFRYASELHQFIREQGFDFCTGGACYPEGHIECLSRDDDLKHLKAKVDAGADFLITQLFFDNAFYFDFVERARHAGIRVPIVPGIMPITNADQIAKFTRLCGATVPMRLALEIERRRDDPEAIVQLGIAHATIQCVELLARGVPGIHFYTLNRSLATRMIVTALQSR
jgi:methylenetetrahydrofolate reductase (NADPH)